MGWIDVKEQLPVPGKRVIVQCDTGWVSEAYLCTGNTWSRYDGLRMWESAFGKVVLWQELPEADKAYIKGE